MPSHSLFLVPGNEASQLICQLIGYNPAASCVSIKLAVMVTSNGQ